MAHRLTVIGTGYLGTTHAACMADLGFEVLGLDADAEKIARLSAGDLPFYEPGLEPVLRRNLANRRLRFTTSFQELADFGDVHFLCVGTPQKADAYAADLAFMDAAVAALAPLLRRPCLVVGKSTVPVGTAERLAGVLAGLAPVGGDAVLAWNPEFLREGFAVRDTLHPDRIVAGLPAEQGAAEHAEKVLREVYAAALADGTPFVTADLRTAELVKTAANAFLATKISFINAMAEVCEAAGADVTRLAEALAHDDRIGGRFLGPGLGFGGGCLPKDIRAFMARADELGASRALTFLREVDEINVRRRVRTVDVARAALGGSFAGRAVAVLGAAFKPDSDDVRDSPALDVAASIQAQGGTVTVFDPKAMANARRVQPSLGFAASAADAARGADAVLLLTEWREFRALAPSDLAPVVAGRVVLDARNVLDADAWRAAGWTYLALGRP
ncbi:UDP-glucose dehydrogenase family protein [Actinomadura sp. WAC 06369]|uniref:UDP-glucose dehydrogenase family protein n=1 Tax=Actinomadura sp. WAC 06369 TaxID=2203193 RepID=UPI000F7834AE|nr:UDP-glucose/GDP-mannose dehydrogenase family protein [Actinomadura sp. WAC 06369]RSN51464.1 UDP-glucose 6-dehydrogenase [Actinomadura sp. WAC 06369]